MDLLFVFRLYFLRVDIYVMTPQTQHRLLVNNHYDLVFKE